VKVGAEVRRQVSLNAIEWATPWRLHFSIKSESLLAKNGPYSWTAVLYRQAMGPTTSLW
jgi:hypothetical protein